MLLRLSLLLCLGICSFPPFFFFNDPPTTEIYTLSLHDALPICSPRFLPRASPSCAVSCSRNRRPSRSTLDRKSTRLNSSHQIISYAVFCLKKKKKMQDR